MANKDTADDVAESHEDAAADGGSVLDKNVSRRTALLGTGIIGSTLASKSAGAVDITPNEPGAAGDDDAPGGGNLAEVLSLNLESDDNIVDVDGSSDIARDYLDMAFPSAEAAVQPGDRVSSIETADRLLTTRDDTFDVDNDDIYQAATATDAGQNVDVFAPFGHVLSGADVTNDLSDTLNPTIGIKVDSAGIGQEAVVLGDAGNEPFTAADFFDASGIDEIEPPSGVNDTFQDREPENVTLVDEDGDIADEFDGTLEDKGFEVELSSDQYQVVFADHRQEVTLPNVANGGELNENEVNQLGLAEDFDSFGDGPEGIFFSVEDSDVKFVIGQDFQPNDEDTHGHTGTVTVVSAQDEDDIRETTFEQQSASIETTVIDLIEAEVEDGTGAVVRLPVDGGDNPNQAEDLEAGDPLGINLPETGSGFTQTDDVTLLSTGEIEAGTSVETQAGDDSDDDNAFVEDNGDFFLEVVTDDDTADKLTDLSVSDVDELSVEQLELTGVGDTGTTDAILLDNRDQILDELEEKINEALDEEQNRDDDPEVVIADVDDIDGFVDADGQDDGFVIRSTERVESPYDQGVDVSSVEIVTGDEAVEGSLHHEATNILGDLDLEEGTFNEVNAATVRTDDIYTAQADPLNLIDETDNDEYLGDFEVTNNDIDDFESAVEQVTSEGGANDIVFRDTLSDDAASAQDKADVGAGAEADADRFDDTRYHDGFDILDLREVVTELAGDDVPHNPRGIDEGDTNVDTYYGDRFDGIRVRNEENLKGENIELAELGLDDTRVGETWTVQKTRGDAGFDEGDTTFWFSKEDLASVSNDLDVVYFGDSNDDVDVDHRSDLTFSIAVEDANEVSDDQFGETALFEVMDLQETDPHVDGDFDPFKDDEDTSAEQGLFFKGHGDRGDIQGSDGVGGNNAEEVQLADLYDPNNEHVPIEYVYGDGDIGTQGLLEAIADYRDGVIDPSRLLDAIGEYRS